MIARELLVLGTELKVTWSSQDGLCAPGFDLESEEIASRMAGQGGAAAAFLRELEPTLAGMEPEQVERELDSLAEQWDLAGESVESGNFVFMLVLGIGATEFHPAVLAGLSHGNEVHRVLAASHHQTPLHCLERLACDSSHEVRIGVAMNSSTPRAILLKMHGDPHPEVHLEVAQRLATDPSPERQRGAA